MALVDCTRLSTREELTRPAAPESWKTDQKTPLYRLSVSDVSRATSSSPSPLETRRASCAASRPR